MLKIFNTLTRKKEVFKPTKKGQVGLYACGPTVYNYAHIGNLRIYIFEDILRRILESGGYKVKHVMNITDVDDKIIHNAKIARKTIFEFVKPYEKAFFEDLNKLNVKKARKYPKATKHIKEMITLIKTLLSKKIAYIASDGVYFDISKFKKYGKLSGITPNPPAPFPLRKGQGGNNSLDFSPLRRGRYSSKSEREGVLADEYDKTNAQDFALWKFKKDGEPSWEAPFWAGRPGWHIECSAMSMKYLGKTFDIHAGGVDLIFPHHENEIAQSESATGKKFVNYFLEGEHLLVDNEKMSKSLGNVYILRDIESKKINPLAFRYFVLGAHYRSKLNFTWEALEASEKALEKLYEFVKILKIPPQPALRGKLPLIKGEKSESGFPSFTRRGLGRYLNLFQSALSDDLNTPKALAVLWDLIHDYRKNIDVSNPQVGGRNIEILKLLYEFDKVLGLGFKSIKRSPISKNVLKLAQEREQFRKNKNWKEADKLRDEIQKFGFNVEDTNSGPSLRKN